MKKIEAFLIKFGEKKFYCVRKSGYAFLPHLGTYNYVSCKSEKISSFNDTIERALIEYILSGEVDKKQKILGSLFDNICYVKAAINNKVYMDPPNKYCEIKLAKYGLTYDSNTNMWV